MAAGNYHCPNADKAFIIDLYVTCQVDSWPNVHAAPNDTVVIDGRPSIDNDMIADSRVGIDHCSGGDDYTNADL